jgi:hypothetical protein
MERYRVLDWGRRAGKSEWGGREALCQLVIPESRVWIAGPTMDLAEKEFRVVWRETVDRADKSLIPIERKSEREQWISFANGSFIECRSEEQPNQLIGEGVDLVLLVEAARMKETSWTQALAPTIADRQGKAIFSSTPRGFNWFWRYFMRGQIDGRSEFPDWRSWQIPTSANPLIPKADIELQRRALPKAMFKQEWLADFTSFSGVVFPEFSYEIHVRAQEYNRDLRTMLWVDPGLSNPYAVLLVQVTPDEQIHVLDEIYVQGKVTDDVIRLVRRRWEPMVYDSSSGNPRTDIDVVIDRAAAEAAATWRLSGFMAGGEKPGVGVGNEVIRRMLRDPYRSIEECFDDHDHAAAGEEHPEGLIVPRMTISPTCVNLIREMGQYHYSETASGSTSENPVDAENHAIDCLRYGIFWTYPTLFLTANPSNEVVELDPDALGIAEALSRMRIDAGYTPERYASFEQQWSLGEL